MGNKIVGKKDEGFKNASQVKHTTISFLFYNFPDGTTLDNLRKVFAKYGQVDDVYVADNNSNGFVQFINIGDVQTFETMLNTIWIGSFKLVVRRNEKKMRSYADLPMDILFSIAARLTPIDLLSFGATCKDFRIVSEKIDVSKYEWLLYHKTKGFGRYIFYDKSQDKTYSRYIPDLEGAYCLGSAHGWLLLFKDELLFFLSPFTLTKITLPDFPHKKNMFSGHVGAFSDVPTSQQCVISIFNRVPAEEEDFIYEVNMICKGQEMWTGYSIRPPNVRRLSRGYICGANFDHKTQTFYYIPSDNQTYHIPHYMVKVSLKDEQWIPYIVDVSFPDMIWSGQRSYAVPSDKRGAWKDDSVDTSGITFHENERYHDIHSRGVDLTPPKTGMRMAIRIQPRFFQLHHS